MSLEDRMTVVEEAVLTLKQLVISHDERLEDYFKALEESRRDFEFKMNALIDSQIRNEAEIRELRESTTKLRESTTELRESTTELRKSTTELRESTNDLKETSKDTLERLDRLERKNGNK